MIIDELISLFGFDIDPSAEGTAARYEGMIAKVGSTIGVVIASLGTAVSAVSAFSVAQSKAIIESGKFADSVQLSFERLQELDYVAKALGEDSNALRSDLNSLNKSMSSLIPGEYNKGLYMLGVSARDASGNVRKVDDVLLDVADRLQGMDERKQMQFADMLGLSPASLALIKKGRDGVEELAAEARALNIVLDEAARVRAEKFNRSFERARAVATGFAQVLAIGLLPLLTEGAEKLTEWVVANGDYARMGIQQVIEGSAKGFGMVSDAIGIAYDWLVKLTGGFIDLQDPLDATNAIAIAVAIGIAAIAASLIAANIPLLVTIAAATALVLVLEDIYAALTGQPSLIGDWAKSFSEAYPEIAGALTQLWELFKSIASYVGGRFKNAFETTLIIVGGLFDFVITTVQNLLSALNQILSGANPFAVLFDLGKATFEKLVELISTVFSAATEGWEEDIKSSMSSILEIVTAAAGRIGDLFARIFGAPGEAIRLMAGVVSSLGANAVASFNAPSNNAAPMPAQMLAAGAGQPGNVTNHYNINGAGNPSAVADSIAQRQGVGQSVQTQTPGARGPVVR